MSLRSLDPRFPDVVPATLSREEWELLFAAVRIRLGRAIAHADTAPEEPMSRFRNGLLECVEALGQLQILLPPVPLLHAAPSGSVDGREGTGFGLKLSATLRPARPAAVHFD